MFGSVRTVDMFHFLPKGSRNGHYDHREGVKKLKVVDNGHARQRGGGVSLSTNIKIFIWKDFVFFFLSKSYVLDHFESLLICK